MISNVKRYATRQIGPWATFGVLMLISLVAWGLGSPELALALSIGAMGAMFVALRDRLHLVRFVRRMWHHG